MANNGHRTHIYVGLAGEGENIAEGGLLRRAEGEDDWHTITNGLPSEPQVRALLVHPDNPAVVYAGTQSGVYRSDDRGDHWEALESPREGMDVWSLAFHPSNPDIIYAGYEPCSISRSEDAGQSWKRMNTDRVAYPNVTTYMPPLAKRVIGIAADPSDPSDMYASIEVGGLLASRDGGESWDSITDGLYTENHTVDLHGVQVSSSGARHRVHHRAGSHVQEPGPRTPLGAYPLRRDVPWRLVLSRPDSRARRSQHALPGGRRGRRWRARWHPGGWRIIPQPRHRRDLGPRGHRRHSAQPYVPDSHRPRRAIQRLLLHRLRPLLRQQRRRRILVRLQLARRTIPQPPRLSHGRRLARVSGR